MLNVFAVYKETISNAPPDWEHGDNKKGENEHVRNKKRGIPAVDEIHRRRGII
jgi:hypothetical protein